MTAEALPAPRMINPQDALHEGRNRLGNLASRAGQRARGLTARFRAEASVEPTSFDQQFDVKQPFVHEAFPKGIEYAFARPDQDTGKPLVVVECGVHEEPDEIKAFMGHLVENGWPILSVYSVPGKEGFYEKDDKQGAIFQKTLATNLLLEDLMEKEGFENFHAFGHSKGGLVAALIARANPQKCLSYTGYAPAGLLDEITKGDVWEMAHNRSLSENFLTLKRAIAHPLQTARDTRGATSMKLYPMLPLLREQDIKTFVMLGQDDPLVPKHRVDDLIEMNDQFGFCDEIVVIPGRHSDLVEQPREHVGGLMRIFHVVEAGMHFEGPEPFKPSHSETVVYQAA